MLADVMMKFGTAGEVSEEARALEARGVDGAWATEIGHDPFTVLSVAAAATTKIELGTSILVAFARSPMVTATLANDLQLMSGGRFNLGLGSQVKPHIEKRYSMPWSQPAARMREYVLALHAIWSSWHDDTKLAFRGEFYRHTLMTPFFSPGPNHYGRPKVFLAAVGELMTEVAGEVADGIFLHAFTTERYLREVTLPAIERGLKKSGRSRSDFQIFFSGIVVANENDPFDRQSTFAARKQVAFYGSTPQYKGVFELHGWNDVQPQLNRLAAAGEWDAMADVITDDVLDAFCLVGSESGVVDLLHKRFGDLVDRFSVYDLAGMDPLIAERVLAKVQTSSN